MSFVSETALHPKTHNQPESGRLRSLVERAQRLNEDKKAIGDDLKELWAEAKGDGYSAKTIKDILKALGQDKATRDEEQMLFSLYCESLGLDL